MVICHFLFKIEHIYLNPNYIELVIINMANPGLLGGYAKSHMKKLAKTKLS